MSGGTRRRGSRTGTGLDALTTSEKAQLFDALVDGDPRLRTEAEERASEMLAQVDRMAVAEEVAAALQGLPHELIGDRAGRQPGLGYVDPSEAAWWLLEEECAPFLEDMLRRAHAGQRDAARQVGLGLLAGLHASQGFSKAGTVLSWGEDFPAEHGREVHRRMRDAGIEPTLDELNDLAPSWTHFLSP